ncbi:HD domain-containing protein [Desulfocurvus sp.]|jgi:response regulator RpfG family c-di-GMP phosphodiesterase|uniref:HD domain-containing phosphohydrolase n=1 Tax=Desulfocurvus sp. TaxID=2871698 RepID=UPI0025C56B0D|nr:HD domain-containing protein [Desulfocurvus sp.]MCK9239043.1 response regulator [Desulfocurvus sp.]
MHDKTILLVDDEAALLEVNREALMGLGCAVKTAGNGAQALDVLDQGGVDLVVTDLRMPRLGGQEMLEEMRARGCDAEVIFLTGYGSVESAVRCIQLGAADYLLKPFGIRDLQDKVAKVLREREMRHAARGASPRKPATPDPQGLDLVLDFTQALRRQRDVRSVVKEFLVQLREAFHPDAMSLFFADGARADLGRDVHWGPLLRDNRRVRDWFSSVATRLMDRRSPRLFESLPVHGEGQGAVSAMLAPVLDGQRLLGMALVLRDHAAGPYSLPALQLLSVFAAHAASALDNVAVQCRLQDMNLEIITSHVRSVEAKDVYTKGHSERVGAYAAMLGREVGLGPADLELLSFAGVLHDVGKIGVPDRILNKPGPLSAAEFEVMKQHPVLGRDILADLRSLQGVLPIVYHHHEWYNGQGYPDGLAGDAIPFLARIVSVVDGYEAMTSSRAYQAARSPQEAAAILRQGAGQQWDGRLVDVWCRIVATRDLARIGAQASLSVTLPLA